MSLINPNFDAPSPGPLSVLLSRLHIPVMAAPMFLVSGPDLLKACCRSGVVGTLPAPNARTVEVLESWLVEACEDFDVARDEGVDLAPWLFNMIVHSTYDRYPAELELVRRFQPPIVSTALGSPRRVLDTVHGYGGQVVSDVITPAMARKAVEAGVDGLILVCNGAGGHTGHYNPFAFIAEVREFWDGPLGLAGAISSGRDVHAAQVMGADFAVIGTRFIAATESLVSDDYRAMLVQSSMDDLVPTNAVSGVLANWMKASLDKAQIDPATHQAAAIDFSGNIATANKAWKDVWSAGHGVGQVKRSMSAQQLVRELADDYRASLERPIPSPFSSHGVHV
jgi:nitronate monooxygenase